MIHVINDSNDPAFNLACEEYLVTAPTDSMLGSNDICMLWQNRPVVVVGRNQNTDLQLNADFIEEQGIEVVRRLSGGGAVYHDAGNLNFTVIKRNASDLRNDFSFFTLPVLEALRTYGADVEFAGRNDLLIDGKKFSGNAQYSVHETLLHHGTILWNSEMAILGKALKAKKRLARGVESVVSRVANVAEYLPKVSLAEFSERLVERLATFGGGVRIDYKLGEEDIAAIERLAEEKYRKASWNWGKSPQYNWVREATLSAGNMVVCADVNDEGIVAYLKIHGDFFEAQPIENLEALFVGLGVEQLAEKAQTLNLGDYVHRLNTEEFIDLLEN